MTAEIQIPNMILIGSMGRNSGKTELACALIRKYKDSDGGLRPLPDLTPKPRHPVDVMVGVPGSISPVRPVVGLKVSTIHGRKARCLRGGKGCGVCTSLKGEYCITEETDPDLPKDTGRMLAAGADRVFWLRVRDAHLTEGVNALLSAVDQDAILICESNSLRLAARPGVFLMLRSATGEDRKESALAVVAHADRIVSFGGERFDLDLDEISFREGRFRLSANAAAAILAGGRSRRMGTDKALLEVDGTPLIQRTHDMLRTMFDEVLVSSNSPDAYSFLDARVVCDRISGAGPLAGIEAVLAASSYEVVFVTACDIPAVQPALVRTMLEAAKEADIVVPRYPDGTIEPLHAVYRKSVAGRIRELLSQGGRRIRELYPHCITRYVPVDNSQEIRNLNTMKEYRTFLAERAWQSN